MKTTFINLFGGPSVSKSTTAAGLFYCLKMNNLNAELITEYAKSRVWANDLDTLGFQPYILGKQLNRQYHLIDKVDYTITDSPVLFSAVYTSFGCVEGFRELVVKQFHLFNNFNVVLERNKEEHKYNTVGRMQTEAEAIEKDKEILAMLDEFSVPYISVKVRKSGEHILDIIKSMQSKGILNATDINFEIQNQII